MKLNLVAFTALAGIAATLVIHYRSQLRLRNNETMLKGQEEQLAALLLENQRLSNRVTHIDDKPPTNATSELARLRNEAEALQKQTNALARNSQQHLESKPSDSEPPMESHPPEYWDQLHQMAGAKALDARNLSSAFQNFALDHAGQFPTNLDQVASYLGKQGMGLSGTNQFDIIYQGSLDQLEGIPVGTIAIVRDRDSWPGPDGKTMRVYGMAGGVGQIVGSDDNFQSWEAKHVIAPPKADPSGGQTHP
jgi:hypothetical protein